MVEAHFQRLKEATDRGQVIIAGEMDEPLDSTFGVVVFEAVSDEAALHLMQTDPTVVAEIMSAALHPYSIALLRK